MSDYSDTLFVSLLRIGQLQKVQVDKLALQEAVESAAPLHNPKMIIKQIVKLMHMKSISWLRQADPAKMPALLFDKEKERWGVLKGTNAVGQWVSEWQLEGSNEWQEDSHAELNAMQIAKLDMAITFKASDSAVFGLVKGEVLSHRDLLRDIIMGGILINVVALATSFYTMQVYDRVIPTRATHTLLVLSLGVLVTILFEHAAKRLRAHVYERLVERVDQRLSRTVYLRFLNIRLDQLPKSVGSLAAQMRGYETVRGFITGITSTVLIDLPFALIFVAIIFMIAGWLAFIPLTFTIICMLVGYYYHNKINLLASQANAASNFKTGLLVESVEGAETIKSGQGGWRMLSRWMNTTDEARSYELEMKESSDFAQFSAASLQQLSYISIVASGALMVSQGELTMGGLIACSILSGRVMGPVTTIPGQLVGWANTKASLVALDQIWALEDDHHGQEQPIVLDHIKGNYQFEEVLAQYGEKAALKIPDLRISQGEKIAVLGPVGAGKTTFLRLLSGMYKPQSGRVVLDDVDLASISKPILAEHYGYVQQEGRLFAGTLRENLILGLLDPGDDVILEKARMTGLLDAVIAANPKGLLLDIAEGGNSLSGGQRQLINLTRAFLREPNIWLLDEPTASMDRNLERRIIKNFSDTLKAKDTFIVVTHKTELLSLVKRIIVIVNNEVVMDGPRNEIIERLKKANETTKEKAS
tara:strand:- start:839 stop:2944 length:2106 start_codon:yes stop_codon:yes gene_type:complete